MADMRDHLRAYIDGIAPAVTPDEVAASPAPDRSLRSRPILALAAGAAIVLVPAALLFGLWLWLGGGGGGTPAASTVTSTTTTTATTAPTTVPVAPVAVPDVTGAGVYAAHSLLGGAGLSVVTDTVVDDARAGMVIGQEPAAGVSVSRGSVVVIHVAAPSPCRLRAPDGVSDSALAVFFNCGAGSFYPDPAPVARPLPAGTGRIGATLRALLAGPSPDESAAGFGSLFGPDSAGALNSIVVTGGTAVVDFNDAIYINNASASTGSSYFLAELGANLFQFPEIDRVEFRVDGSCVDFWSFLQVGECVVVDRTDWELDQARTALFDYFELLRAGSYLLAADRYGGDYSVLEDWNPTVDAADLYTLWKQGCTVNGLACLRAAEANLVERGPATFTFEVDFETADGQPFSCCDTGGGPATRFTFTVTVDEAGRYRVMELPVYVP